MFNDAQSLLMNPLQAIAGTMGGGQDQQDPNMQQAAWNGMGQIGALLMAAGGRMTSQERARLLAGIAPVIGNIPTTALNSAQAQLMQTKAVDAQKEQQRQAQIENRLSDPAFAQGLGLTPEQAQLLGASGAIDAIKARAAHDPAEMAIKMATLQRLSQPEYKTVGYDSFGKPRIELVAPGGEIITPAGQNNNPPSITEQVRGLQGMDVINRLKEFDPGLASQVDAIASGRQPFPTSLMRSQRGEVISDLVNMVDPTYSAATYGNRKKLTDSAASTSLGSMGGQITFGNTAIKHLGELHNLVDELHNKGGFPGSYYWNKAGNAMLESRGGGASLAKWKATAQNAADEIAKFYGAGGVGDREKIAALFDAARSPEELRAVIQEQMRDIFAKTSNLQNQWSETMGPYASGKKFIYDDTQKVVDRVLNGASEGGGSIPAAAIEMLKSNPAAMREHFDAKYGAGAAAKVLGQ